MDIMALDKELDAMMSRTPEYLRDIVIRKFMRVLACAQDVQFEEKMKLRSAAKDWFTERYGELPYFNYARRQYG